MNEHEALSLVDMAVKHGIREIDILGGEPLLISWMKNFVTYASDSGLAVNLSTNGGLSDLIVDLAETFPPRLISGFPSSAFLKPTTN